MNENGKGWEEEQERERREEREGKKEIVSEVSSLCGGFIRVGENLDPAGHISLY